MGRALNVDVGGHEETVELLKALFKLRGSSISREIKAWIVAQAKANKADLDQLRKVSKPAG